MRRYRGWFAFAASVLSLPCGFLLFVAVMNRDGGAIAFWFGILALWWGLYALLRREVRFAVPISAGVAFLLWAPLLWQTVGRLLFMHENGLEEPDGTGSPMAFVMGLVMEQLFFVPLTFVLASALDVLVATARRRRMRVG